MVGLAYNVLKSPNDLRPHPMNVEIYGAEEADPDLVDSIRHRGILDPLVIREDNTILSGHRRCVAAKALGLDRVPVRVVAFDDQADEEEALIEWNRQREKTFDQKMRESKCLERIIAARAKARQESTRFGGAGKIAGTDERGETRETLATAVGMRARTFVKAREMWDAAENGDEVAATALQQHAAGDLSISAAYEKFREKRPPKQNGPAPKPAALQTFNQTNDNIEWARWSWNPVTGCLHDCVYCYARDIANRFFPEGFKPTYHPERLAAPQNTKVPAAAVDNQALRNVFVCSMADLFGAWVPAEWIQSVLDACEAAPQWNFLFLTKNPSRLPEFRFPANSWVGTTVDTQARAGPAQEALARVNPEVGATFVSCEPLREEVLFPDPIAFDWMIVGGQSSSSKCPEFQPEWDWVEGLLWQAREANCRVYFKPNLKARPREYPGGGA
jgi:protein gp37